MMAQLQKQVKEQVEQAYDGVRDESVERETSRAEQVEAIKTKIRNELDVFIYNSFSNYNKKSLEQRKKDIFKKSSTLLAKTIAQQKLRVALKKGLVNQVKKEDSSSAITQTFYHSRVNIMKKSLKVLSEQKLKSEYQKKRDRLSINNDQKLEEIRKERELAKLAQ